MSGCVIKVSSRDTVVASQGSSVYPNGQGRMVRRNVAADNSCLFNAIGYIYILLWYMVYCNGVDMVWGRGFRGMVWLFGALFR